MNILDDTGHSYSGISDLIRNNPEKTKSFIDELTRFYFEKVEKQKQIEEQLEKVKNNRAIAVSDFVFAMKAIGEKRLVYKIDNAIIVVDMINYEERRINIESYPLTDFNGV